MRARTWKVRPRPAPRRQVAAPRWSLTPRLLACNLGASLGTRCSPRPFLLMKRRARPSSLAAPSSFVRRAA
eukprot:4247985-Pyramimonas_sp.AAC.1